MRMAWIGVAVVGAVVAAGVGYAVHGRLGGGRAELGEWESGKSIAGLTLKEALDRTGLSESYPSLATACGFSDLDVSAEVSYSVEKGFNVIGIRAGDKEVLCEVGTLTCLKFCDDRESDIPSHLTREDAISEEEARDSAEAFLRAVGNDQVLSGIQGGFMDFGAGGAGRKDLLGVRWTFFVEHAYPGFTCTANMVIEVCPYSGRVMRFRDIPLRFEEPLEPTILITEACDIARRVLRGRNLPFVDTPVPDTEKWLYPPSLPSNARKGYGKDRSMPDYAHLRPCYRISFLSCKMPETPLEGHENVSGYSVFVDFVTGEVAGGMRPAD